MKKLSPVQRKPADSQASYPTLKEARVSYRAMLGGLGAAIVTTAAASACNPFVSTQGEMVAIEDAGQPDAEQPLGGVAVLDASVPGPGPDASLEAGQDAEMLGGVAPPETDAGE